MSVWFKPYERRVVFSDYPECHVVLLFTVLVYEVSKHVSVDMDIELVRFASYVRIYVFSVCDMYCVINLISSPLLTSAASN